jgi:hypothetical protein
VLAPSRTHGAADTLPPAWLMHWPAAATDRRTCVWKRRKVSQRCRQSPATCGVYPSMQYTKGELAPRGIMLRVMPALCPMGNPTPPWHTLGGIGWHVRVHSCMMLLVSVLHGCAGSQSVHRHAPHAGTSHCCCCMEESGPCKAHAEDNRRPPQLVLPSNSKSSIYNSRQLPLLVRSSRPRVAASPIMMAFICTALHCRATNTWIEIPSQPAPPFAGAGVEHVLTRSM